MQDTNMNYVDRTKLWNEDVSPRRSRASHILKTEAVQLRLLRMDEKCRSKLLYDQIKAFEDKVCLSYDQFNVDILHRMIVDIGKRTVVDIRRIKSIGNLRQCVRDEKKNIRCRLRNRHVTATREEERILKYFRWFFQFLDFIREMRNHFVERIYNPLFRYFYNTGYDKSDREDSVDSDFSIDSFRSHDSEYTGLTGMTSVLADADQRKKSLATLSSRSTRSDFDETNEQRRKIITKNALLILGREFRDIKQLYDMSELKKVAQRLAHLKERIDSLIDTESKINNALLCQDSERPVFSLRIKEAGIESLVRLLPDILIKFQKAAWLVRRWLELDGEKTNDLNERLQKIMNLEKELSKRLTSLSEEIHISENEHDVQSGILNRLLEREERVNSLSQNVFDLQNRKHGLTSHFKILQNERNNLAKKLTVAVRTADIHTCKTLRPLYEKNRLHRFAVERQLATIVYHLDLTEEDVNIELEFKPSIINTTNDVQDHCEALEQRIEKARREHKVIQAALIPIAEDKMYVARQIQIKDRLKVDDAENNVYITRGIQITDKSSVSNSKLSLKAEFVNTFVKCNTPDEIMDLNTEYLGSQRSGSVSLFLTAVSDDQDSRVTPGHNSMQVLEQGDISRTPLAPEVVASEW